MLDQLLIPTWYFAIFNLYGEILSWLFTGVKGKTNLHSCHKKKIGFPVVNYVCVINHLHTMAT